MRAKE
jgi:hypothetical protein